MRDVDAMQLALSNAASDLGVLVNVHPDLAAREACEAIQLQATKLNVRISQSRPIYEALTAIDKGALDAHARRALDLTLQDMRRAGAGLDEAARAKVCTSVSASPRYQSYARNCVMTSERSSCLPPLSKTCRRITATRIPRMGACKVKVTTDPPDMTPLMTYSFDKSARLALAKAYYDRARANIDVFEQLRARGRARDDAGYASFAAYNLEDKMMASPENLDRSSTTSAPRRRRRPNASTPRSSTSRGAKTRRRPRRHVGPHASHRGAKDERFKFDPREMRRTSSTARCDRRSSSSRRSSST